MERPAQEIRDVVYKLTQGSPDEQHDAIYRYFAPGATFEHPFCRVPSFRDLTVPGLGTFDSRVLIEGIYRWYKILSPKISLEIESCAHDERQNLLFLQVFQVFSIWFIPFYRAPVRLVSVLHLAPSRPASDGTAAAPSLPPRPRDAAQEKLSAVREGAEPSYAAVASGEAPSPTTSPSPTTTTDNNNNNNNNSSSSSSSSSNGNNGNANSNNSDHSSSNNGARSGLPTRYLITKQRDLYQANDSVRFVALGPGSVAAALLQLVATLLCLLGTLLVSAAVGAGASAGKICPGGGDGGKGKGKKANGKEKEGKAGGKGSVAEKLYDE